MALLIPDTPRHCTPSERQIFHRMEHELDAGWVVLHSMDLLQHQTKIVGETDFIVLSTKGVFVVEVKGGIVSCRDGVWRYTDPGTRKYYEKREGPFAQANGAMFALRAIIDKKPEFRDLLIGSGVIMPRCTFTATGPEIEQAVLLDSRRFHESFGLYIGSLARHWDQRYRDTHGKARRSPTRDELSRIRQLLRPDAESTPALSSIYNGVEERMLLLTEQQVRALRGAENNPRALIFGRAGTGKTVIAKDRALRLARKGKRVLFICFNQLLARHVEAAIMKESGGQSIQVKHIHGLYHETISRAGLQDQLKEASDDPKELYGRAFPNLFLEAAYTIGQETFDVLIVDEAQDTLTPPNLDALDVLVEGGIRRGQWTLLMDPKQNIYGSESEDAMAVLAEAGYASYTLEENCRNTREIATQCSIISGIDAAIQGAMPGVPCDCVFYADDADLIRKLNFEMQRLIAGGVQPKDIVILSTRRRENSAVATVKELAKQKIVDIADAAKAPETVHFATMHAFKGLERQVVLAIDLTNIGQEHLSLLHYAGLSRPTTLLRTFMSAKERDAYAAQARKFGERMSSI